MFVVKFLLDASNNEKLYLDKTLNCEQKSANVVVKHCIHLLNKLKYDSIYQNLLKQRLSTTDKKEIKVLNKQLNEYRDSIGLSLNKLQKYAKVQQKKYKNYISSQEMQVIVSNIWNGVEKILFGEGEYLHYKKKGYYDCLSAKSLNNGIRLTKHNTVIVGKMEIPFIVKEYDEYAKFALEYRTIKYARLKRLYFNNGYKYYVEFVFDGVPMLKHSKGKGDCGLDVGVSSVAVVSDDNCMLEDLAPKIDGYNKQIKNYQKQLEQSKKVNNSNCYDENGKIIKGSKFKRTKNYFKILYKLKTLYRKRKCYVTEHHNMLCNKIIEHCEQVYIEPVNFKALQKRTKTLARQQKQSVVVQKDGSNKLVHKYKRKKRFGKSLNNKSPSSFITTLKQKCNFYEIEVIEIDTTNFRASQYNHETYTYIKKELKDRWNLINGEYIQRDLYSAFLIKNTDQTLTHPDRLKCNNTFEDFKILHKECIEITKAINLNRLSCFGF